MYGKVNQCMDGQPACGASMTKASWAVIDPEGLPAAVERALRVAMTPPVGPVHLAVYDRMLGPDQFTANLIEGDLPDIRAGRSKPGLFFGLRVGPACRWSRLHPSYLRLI